MAQFMDDIKGFESFVKITEVKKNKTNKAPQKGRKEKVNT